VAGVTDHDAARWAYLAEGNATQARKRVSAKVLMHDSTGDMLLVNPSYKEHWDLPGGMAEANEPPRAAAERELREELGLATTVGRLLLIDWVGPRGPWDDQLIFVFDGGTLTPVEAAGLRLADPELTAFEFVNTDTAHKRLRSDVARRLDRALQALANATTTYDEQPADD
jgi:ADP-ribose pyrophosphatase YjhB (NUDIX family)